MIVKKLECISVDIHGAVHKLKSISLRKSLLLRKDNTKYGDFCVDNRKFVHILIINL